MMTAIVMVSFVVIGGAGDPTVCCWVPSEICKSAGAAAASSSLYPAAVPSALHSSQNQAWQKLSCWESEWSEGQPGSPSWGRWPNSPEVTTAETSSATSQAFRRSALQLICMRWNCEPAQRHLHCAEHRVTYNVLLPK